MIECSPKQKACCGRQPMLRVRPQIVRTTEIAYVRFECSVCGHTGPPAVSEDAALFGWLQENRLTTPTAT